MATTVQELSPPALTMEKEISGIFSRLLNQILTLFDQRLLTKGCQKYFSIHKLLINIDKEHPNHMNKSSDISGE